MNVFNTVTPGRRPSQMNDDIGGAFQLTEIKKKDSRVNLNSQSPDTRGSAFHLGKDSNAQISPTGFVNSPQSPGGGNMLVSFNFLTQVPIEEFVIQEHSKASKLSARLKTNASLKIERELERNIKDKE